MIRVLNQQGGDAVELRNHEARATGEGLHFTAVHVGGVEHDISRIRVGIEGDTRHIPSTVMRGKDEDCVRRSPVFSISVCPRWLVFTPEVSS